MKSRWGLARVCMTLAVITGCLNDYDSPFNTGGTSGSGGASSDGSAAGPVGGGATTESGGTAGGDLGGGGAAPFCEADELGLETAHGSKCLWVATTRARWGAAKEACTAERGPGGRLVVDVEVDYDTILSWLETVDWGGHRDVGVWVGASDSYKIIGDYSKCNDGVPVQCECSYEVTKACHFTWLNGDFLAREDPHWSREAGHTKEPDDRDGKHEGGDCVVLTWEGFFDRECSGGGDNDNFIDRQGLCERALGP
jgi:hypothetical protein